MANGDASQADFRTIWATLELDETVRIDATVASGVAHDWRDTLRNSLPQLPLGEADDAQFKIAGVIGRGGMGVVHEAKQRSLARAVAIKTVPDDKVSRLAENALLQEARVMGMVEHPNVVPVHIIGQDERGRPVIVMKRIHGTPWTDYIDGSADVPDDDPLAFHLQVAQGVCRALSFAHDRGVIHRDIKPENVMVGRFGEVYLLDWGLALALGPNEGGIPTIVGANEVVGTPAFMAPEMTIGRGDELGVHTDVFLLGATVYTAVTGRPPHAGETLFDVMRAAFSGAREGYPVTTPSELRDVCERAMAVDPAERFATVDELREALESFLSHRSSHVLVGEARARLFALREAIVADDEDAVHQVFGEARFGFVSALKIWSDNHDAHEGLRATLIAMIEWELEHEHLAAARALYGQLVEPEPELGEAIEKLAHELESREARLEKIAFDYDENVGITERRRLIGVMGATILFAPLIKWIWVDDWVVPDALRGISTDPVELVTVVFGLAFLPILAAIIWVTATQYLHHKVSRIFTAALTIMYVLGMTARSQVLMNDVPLHVAMAMELAVHTTGLFCMGLSIDRRMGRAGYVTLATMVAVLVIPAYPVEIFCFGLGAASMTFAFMKRPGNTLPWARE